MQLSPTSRQISLGPIRLNRQKNITQPNDSFHYSNPIGNRAVLGVPYMESLPLEMTGNVQAMGTKSVSLMSTAYLSWEMVGRASMSPHQDLLDVYRQMPIKQSDSTRQT